jgi:hypothetical protein
MTLPARPSAGEPSAAQRGDAARLSSPDEQTDALGVTVPDRTEGVLLAEAASSEPKESGVRVMDSIHNVVVRKRTVGADTSRSTWGGAPVRSITDQCHDMAEADIRECVSEYRQFGRTSLAAQWLIAKGIGIPFRWVRSLFYAEGQVYPDRSDQHRIACGVICILERLALYHEEAAARCRAKADAIKIREQQLTLPPGEPCSFASGVRAGGSIA